MNREIKFRAVVGVNSWKPTSIEYFDLSLDDDIIRLKNADYDINQLMQYTGLKDKNGVEIYEGDVVKWNNNIQIGNSTIVFYDGCFRLEDYPFSEYNKLETGSRIEVIGNIYENPELIK